MRERKHNGSEEASQLTDNYAQLSITKGGEKQVTVGGRGDRHPRRWVGATIVGWLAILPEIAEET